MIQPVHNRKYIFALGCLGMLVMSITAQVLPAALGPVSREFNRDLAERGILLLLTPLGFIISTLISGYLSDRCGQRVFILLGSGIISVGLALSAWSPTYAALSFGLFLVGFSGGLLESPISAVVSDVFPERRAQVLNLTQIFYNIGAVAGPALVAALFRIGWGWRSAFACCVPLAVASLILGAQGLPKHKVSPETEAKSNDAGSIRWGLVTTICLAMFLYVGAEMTIGQWSANYVERTFVVDPSRAALAMSAFWLCMGLGRAMYILIISRFGYLLPLVISGVLAATFGFLAATAHSALWAGAACALVGFSLAGSWPTILGYSAQCNPRRTGTVFGIVVSAGAAGQVFWPPLAGWVAKHSVHEIRAAIALGACLAIMEAAVIFGLLLNERRGTDK